MLKSKRSLLVGGLGGCLLCAASSATAQESTTNSAAPATNSTTVIGPPQLRDFSLQPQERIVSQPDPAPQAPVELAPPPPTTSTAPPQPAQQAAARPPQTQPSRPAEIRTEPSASEPAPVTSAPAAPAPTFEATPVAPPAAQPVEEAAEAPAEQAGGGSYWLYAIPAAALALLGVALVRRRRIGAVEPVAEAAPVAAPPPKPRPEPIPRPWLELELKTDRASFTATEAVIQFELSVRNTGKSPARNLRIDVKMFNAGREQDQEIGAFFKTAGRDSTKLNLPGIGAESTGVIRGEVAMPREEIRAVRLDDRLLFIPVVAVNVLYDWGEERTGQTSKSYVVGRELQEQSDNKMGAFRVDQGPRIWRTVGQRPHKLAKRV